MVRPLADIMRPNNIDDVVEQYENDKKKIISYRSFYLQYFLYF